jgi:hypothetical protein
MPYFHHTFEPAAANPVGNSVDLTTREIEDAGLQEILQTPGVALGNWRLFDALLDPGSMGFTFREPLGHAREVKTAVSGLFGRFVARAYATRYLGFSYYTHIHGSSTRLSGRSGGEVRRVPGASGDMPDWAVWSVTGGLGIIEAKGCHDPKGPQATLNRAYQQAERAEIVVRGRRAPFKRFAIATRWGFASPSTVPMLAVKDPAIEGEGVSPEEIQALASGIIRRHCAGLLQSLGQLELATALSELVNATFTPRYSQALNGARTALGRAAARTVVMSGADGPDDDLVGNYITRGGPLGDITLSAPDQEALTRLKLRPTFIGIEHRVLKAAIEAEPGTLANLRRGTVQAAQASPIDRSKPRNDGAGGWVIRLDEDDARLT